MILVTHTICLNNYQNAAFLQRLRSCDMHELFAVFLVVNRSFNAFFLTKGGLALEGSLHRVNR